MVTIILATALLIALLGLGVEIGIASWNIRRANRYRYKETCAKHALDQAERGRKSLNDYAGKISWLLTFLYNYYDKFVGMEEDLKRRTSGEVAFVPPDENILRCEDMKKALKIIKVTVRASERVNGLMDSISELVEDLQNEDETGEQESDGGTGENTTAEAAESKSPENGQV